MTWHYTHLPWNVSCCVSVITSFFTAVTCCGSSSCTKTFQHVPYATTALEARLTRCSTLSHGKSSRNSKCRNDTHQNTGTCFFNINTCTVHLLLFCTMTNKCQSQWPRGLRHRSSAARLLIVGSNPAGGTDVCLLWVLCVVR